MTCHPSLYMPKVILITNVFSLLYNTITEDRKVEFNLDSQHLRGYLDALHLGKKAVCQSPHTKFSFFILYKFEEHGK